ncbi:hypothetical protein EYF80_001133 [Liparis tanakae]|uniref:Uncharacterized protein n=1 Tax=Liparis tanakae TaxID=230148 RepID=A0A4Z2JFK2_9TELE|nr:hypothetical protein EYF80_001133 [Liparis tanakae]
MPKSNRGDKPVPYGRSDAGRKTDPMSNVQKKETGNGARDAARVKLGTVSSESSTCVPGSASARELMLPGDGGRRGMHSRQPAARFVQTFSKACKRLQLKSSRVSHATEETGQRSQVYASYDPVYWSCMCVWDYDVTLYAAPPCIMDLMKMPRSSPVSLDLFPLRLMPRPAEPVSLRGTSNMSCSFPLS